jgi:hypothetical protein
MDLKALRLPNNFTRDPDAILPQAPEQGTNTWEKSSEVSLRFSKTIDQGKPTQAGPKTLEWVADRAIRTLNTRQLISYNIGGLQRWRVYSL